MNEKELTRLLIGAPLIVFALILVLGSFTTIPAGHRGVVLKMGAVTGRIMDEGFNLKLPILNTVELMEVRVKKEDVISEAASSDLQTVDTKIVANLRVDPLKCATLFQTVGHDYNNRIVDPAMQESIKAAIAKYTAEELITRREEVRIAITKLLVARLAAHGIILENINIVDFNFSKTFNRSIEAKVTAEQNALTAQNKLVQVEFEAQQRVTEAKGKAEAITVEAAALRDSPDILTLRALEKWDGVLPRVTGSSVPFINIDMMDK